MATYIRRPFPAHTLEAALQIARAIQDANNGQPMDQGLLAQAVRRKPASSEFRLLLSSSLKYGLTTGTEKSNVIGLTANGESVVKPRDSSERAKALKTAALQPQLLRSIYQHYNDGKLPQGDFFSNVLERNFNVPRDRCQQCAELLVQNGRYVGIVQEEQGALSVFLKPEPTAEPAQDDVAALPQEVVEEEGALPSAPPKPEPPPPAERYIFIAHGKNHTPLEQLKKVLDQFKIRYKVAIDEPQKARPISVKVAENMRSCQSAIFIFSADEQFTNAEGQTVWRPSQNVIYELGAASVLYGDKIVIFKEQGLDFPTDFRDIGNIPFDKDALDARGVQLIAELIALGLVAVQPT